MKPLLQKNLRSVMFVVMLTILGLSIASILIFDLSGKGRLAFILIAVSCFFASLSFFLEILKRKKNNND
jgi:hypothetical protein